MTEELDTTEPVAYAMLDEEPNVDTWESAADYWRRLAEVAIKEDRKVLKEAGKIIVDRDKLKRIQTADLANRDSEAYLILEEILRSE